MSAQLSLDFDIIGTFVVTEFPAPIPSMFNGCPEPTAAIKTLAKVFSSSGKSFL